MINLTRLALALLLGTTSATLHAQTLAPSATLPISPAPASADCSYARCALGIAPVWNGLAIVQGPERQQLGNLNFFWPRGTGALFSGDSARMLGDRAMRTRRIAAVLTDVGGLMVASAAIRARGESGLTRSTRSLALGGAAAFVVSVPLQFAADGLLSRAVWWHNAAFGR